ncbi:ABC transporter ATP-binding protein [Desulfobacca acetoxidans]|uniref:Sulfate-transporting ATPase n=1 Tax=Desulfobacca acetoxidans (strain ATCC 700848 / DSM 11109 / ASRB2) TaxID=880072 RepID=F2NIW6_DESAR|nr:ABC transporter ATP-binding protein [Desulfobacca acetoxidans]AEB10660.1 Sulfate-transporting ATPase [Desulfobacca acetoxidans DSM 11109]
MHVIHVKGLTKRFGTLVAVDNLTLTVAKGESFALVGPDGAGKTTTIRLLCGIMDPDSGWGKVLTYDTIRETERIKDRIGYMPQRFGLYDDLTVAENLAFYADIYRVPKDLRRGRTKELLEFARLEQFQSRLAAKLSGGMRQKLGLICTLVHRPEIIFLDEPTFGVDPVSRREFWQILYQLQLSGITIFLSTSYMDEAERAHRVGLLHRGRLLLTDTPRSVRASFQGELLELKNAELHKIKKILDDHPLVQQTYLMGERLMITVDQSTRALATLQQYLAASGISDVILKTAEPGLEDVFVQIIRCREEETRSLEKGNTARPDKLADPDN